VYPSPRYNNVYSLPQGAPRLHQMAPGQLFRATCNRNLVLVRLLHAQLAAADSATIWCVVIASNAESDAICGTLLALPGDSVVEPVHLAGPMSIAAGRH